MTAVPAPQSVARRAPRGPVWRLRAAAAEDLDALLQLEHRCFTYDRLSRRSFRHFLNSDTATCLVAEQAGRLEGYVLVLFHGRTALARLYSMAVAPEQQGQGLGRELLRTAEATALDRGAAVMRLGQLASHPDKDRRCRTFVVVDQQAVLRHDDHHPGRLDFVQPGNGPP
jgi:GNAT superfamily N-acetyltransferase